jgi:hypothetical protein
MRDIDELLKKIDEHGKVGFRGYIHYNPSKRWHLNKLTEMYLEQMETVKDRISDILKVANCGLDNGMNLTEVFMTESYARGMLFSTTVNHQMGLIVCPLDGKLYLGFNRESSTIATDFMTNGEESFEYNRYSRRKQPPSYFSLKHFFLAFDQFEEGFYSYIEKEVDYYDQEGNEEALMEHYFGDSDEEEEE